MTLDRSVASERKVSHFGANNYKGGRAIADYVKSSFPNGADIVLLTGQPGSSRTKGIRDSLQAGGDKYRLVVDQTGNWMRSEGMRIVESVLPSLPKRPQVILLANDDMALAAIYHGKHVYSEKPLALNACDAKEMAEMAEMATRAGVKTLVGFNYVKNPAAKLAKEIIGRGELGEVIHFYGTHNEDYMADPSVPIHWHCYKGTAGLGALGDLAGFRRRVESLVYPGCDCPISPEWSLGDGERYYLTIGNSMTFWPMLTYRIAVVISHFLIPDAFWQMKIITEYR